MSESAEMMILHIGSVGPCKEGGGDAGRGGREESDACMV